MIETVQIAVLLLAVLAAVAVAARRLDLPPAILLVVVGVALALVPGLPQVQLVPELVLLLVLPPLIYSAGVAMSWREFRFNLRPIGLLAIGCVVFTTATVAVVAHALLGLPWAVGFVLGAIISPPDVVAPLAIARRLGLPRRLLVILEGEGLANDATALILYRFAVAAVSTGAFALGPAPVLMALALRREPGLGGLRNLLWVNAVLMASLLAVMMGVGDLVTLANVGLWQRANALTMFPWIGIAAWWLLRASAEPVRRQVASGPMRAGVTQK